MTAMKLLFAAASLTTIAAQAHPGAKSGDELTRNIVIKSTCFSSTPASGNVLFGYEQEAAKASADGKCPTGSVIAARTYLQQQPDPDTAKATGKQVILRGTQGMTDFGIWTIEHELLGTEHGSTIAQQDLDDATYSVEFEALKTASPATPVAAKIDYPNRKISALKRSKLPTEATLNIVSVCISKKSGDVYGYTEAETAPKYADYCPDVFQVVLKRESTIVFNEETYTSLKHQNSGYGTFSEKIKVANSVQILSRYGLPLFSVPVNSGVITKARIDFKTASPENPVKVTVDEKTKAVLSIVPSISPYKL